jgi:hypothetical protein
MFPDVGAAEARELFDEGLVDAPEEQGVAVHGQGAAAALAKGELRHLPRLGLDLKAQDVKAGRRPDLRVGHVERERGHHHHRAFRDGGGGAAGKRPDDHARAGSERPAILVDDALRVVSRCIYVHRQRRALGPGRCEEAVTHRLRVARERVRGKRQQQGEVRCCDGRHGRGRGLRRRGR